MGAPVDVVVVGLGPAGTIAARVLAAAGLRVVALEAGPGAGGGAPGTPAARSPIAAPPPTIRRHAGERATPAPGPPAGCNAIGGAKRLAAAQSYRLDPWSLRVRSATDAGHGPGALDPEVMVEDWPLTAADLDPYHDRVERLLEVAGGAASGGRELPGALAPTAWTTRMAGAARRRGWTPFAAPAALRSDALAPPAAGSVSDELLAAAIASGAVEVRSEATALEVLVDGDRVRGVRYRRAGRTLEQRARAVVLAASVFENVRLLLLSRSPAFPAGLANGSGQVGRHFMAHSVLLVHGLFAGEDLGRASGTPAQATAIADFDGDAFDHRGLGFVGGSLLQAAMTGPTAPGGGPLATAPPPGIRPGTPAARRWAADHGRSVGSVWAQPEQLPRAGHRLDLDPAHADPLGRPVLRVTHGLAVDDRRRAAFLAARMGEWLREAGAARVWTAPLVPQPLGTHLYGGTRMGGDPATSVVDADGIAHGRDDLAIVGSSTFPTTGGRGPTQTIEALAWRTAERLAARLGGDGAARPQRASWTISPPTTVTSARPSRQASGGSRSGSTSSATRSPT